MGRGIKYIRNDFAIEKEKETKLLFILLDIFLKMWKIDLKNITNAKKKFLLF